METTKQYRNSIPPDVEAIGHGKWYVHWNVQEVIPEPDAPDQTVQYQYNEVCLDHEPTHDEIATITGQ